MPTGPFSSKRRAASRLRADAAECSGMTTVGFAATTSTAAPFSISRRAAAGWPKKQAKCRAVKPSLEYESTEEELTAEDSPRRLRKYRELSFCWRLFLRGRGGRDRWNA